MLDPPGLASGLWSPLKDTVVSALLEAATKYKLKLTKPGAEAIYDKLGLFDINVLRDKGS